MFVVLPPGYQPGQKYPLVQVVHGGPHGISADAFHFRWNGQAFAAPGYVAALVNFQGSTSWGQDFAKRIQGAWGDRPFDDVMKATDVLIAAGLVDETKMAAVGGSYGGYMMSWIEGHTDRFKCIVNHAGVYDLMSQYASDVTQGRAAVDGRRAVEGDRGDRPLEPGALRGRVQHPDAGDPRREGLPGAGERRGSSATACSRPREFRRGWSTSRTRTTGS